MGDWTYSVAFKKKGSGRLKWIATPTTDATEASKAGRLYMATHYPGKGYREYGLSKTPKEPTK